MLHPTVVTLHASITPLPANRHYFLSGVRLDIPDATTAIVHAKLNGPANAPVWARAWLASEADGTLAETASRQLTSGDEVTLTLSLGTERRIPTHAYVRIESAPLVTEHVVGLALPTPST